MTDMLHHLRISWRNMRKHKAYTLTHIMGLAIGMAASLLILELLVFEYSFDRFHADSEQIYRVTNDRFQNGERSQHGTITYAPVGRVMEEDLPEVIDHLRLMPAWGNTGVQIGERVFTETNVLFANSNFFEFFSFPLIKGNPGSCLTAPHQLALSASFAKKYFQLDDPAQAIGEQIIVNQVNPPFEVTAIFEDVPATSHLQFGMVISFASFQLHNGNELENNWRWSDFWHYVKLQEGATPESLRAKLDAFSETHFRGTEVSGSEEVFDLQPLTEAHLYSDYEYEIGQTADGETFELLYGIALFILLLAWINYINLTTARALERAREVGIRKVMGAHRAQLIRQFLTESVLYNLLGLVVALTLIQLIQPLFNQWLGRSLSLFTLWQSPVVSWLNPWYFVLFVLLGMLASGFYPAFILSAYKPAAILAGTFKHSTKGRSLRQGLVIFQFACSSLLITATLAIYQQIQYMNERDLGIELDQVVVLEGPYLSNWDSTWIQNIHAFKGELKRIPSVSHVTTSENLAGSRLGRIFGIRMPGSKADQQFTASRLSIDHDFVETYQLKLLAGRDLRATDHHQDMQALKYVLVNESLVKMLGFEKPEDAVQQNLLFNRKSWEIAGVVADFHQQNLRLPIEPLIFPPVYSTRDYISIRLQGKDMAQSLESIRELYAHFFPDNPFEYFFMDQQFAGQYASDKQFGQIITLFTLLAIFIACLGLLGLAAYSILQRRKEIGIRKILGASMAQLFVMLSGRFLRLVGLASLLAMPVAWWAISWWLEHYAFHIPFSLLFLLIPAVVVMGIAILTVSWQTYHSANKNPVESLRL